MLRALFQLRLPPSAKQFYSIQTHGHCFIPSLLYSTSSRTTSHNYHLRKSRLPPHKLQVQQNFGHQLAMNKLQESVKSLAKSPKDVLEVLLDSFSSYECQPTPYAYRFIIKTLIKNPSTWDQIPKVLAHLQKDANFEMPEKVLIDLIKFYGNSDKLDTAIELFFNFAKFRCNPSVKSLNVLLVVTCKRKKRLGFVPGILMRSSLMSICIEGSSLEILIKALCRYGSYKYAVELVDFSFNEGYTIDESIYSLIVSKMCRGKGSDKVEIWRFFEKMKRYEVSPREVDWCNVIHYFVKNGTREDALEAFSQMKLDRLQPNVCCFNLILKGFVTEGLYQEADELFDDMLVAGSVPDMYTYNVFISGLCKQNKLEEGVEMLSSMEQLGCKPDIATYHIVLQGMCMMRKLNMIGESLRKMTMMGMDINMQTYEIIIGSMISKGDFDDALDFLKEKVCNCSGAHSVALDEMIHALCLRDLLGEAVQVLQVMVQKNVAPGGRAWKALLEQAKISHSFEIPQVV